MWLQNRLHSTLPLRKAYLVYIMPSSAVIGCINHSDQNPLHCFHKYLYVKTHLFCARKALLANYLNLSIYLN